MTTVEADPRPGQRVAIIGSGVSGLVCAYLLHPAYDVTVFEADRRLGGHTNTVIVNDPGAGPLAIDTGFIVFNEWTYPHFIQLLERLDVAWRDSDMSFSVSCRRSGLEYGGGGFRAVFAQPENMVSPRFLRMLADLVRFYQDASVLLDEPGDETLGEFVSRRGYSDFFIEKHLVPIGAAIWSADPRQWLQVPARFAIRFFANHGMLNLLHRPLWRTVVGGSRSYVEALVRRVGSRRFLVDAPVLGVRRDAGGVELDLGGHADGRKARFDQVILAVHSDQALGLLVDPSPIEREVLGSIRYQPNQAVLHTDTSLLPRARRAWSSWNYLIPESQSALATLTYNMNMLQGLPSEETYCVTLNPDRPIAPERVLGAYGYAHPVFDPLSVRAQQRWGELSGRMRTHYCGAYWRYGFHEDGVVSALRVARRFGRTL